MTAIIIIGIVIIIIYAAARKKPARQQNFYPHNKTGIQKKQKLGDAVLSDSLLDNGKNKTGTTRYHSSPQSKNSHTINYSNLPKTRPPIVDMDKPDLENTGGSQTNADAISGSSIGGSIDLPPLSLKDCDQEQQDSRKVINTVIQSLLQSIDIVDKDAKETTISDDAIIDVTDQAYEQGATYLPEQNKNELPYYWKNKVIYSYAEINSTNPAQKAFYFSFRRSFFNNIYTNLKGNDNYKYILFYDLLKEYDWSNSVRKLEEHINRLVLFYPDMKELALPCLERSKTRQTQTAYAPPDYTYDSDYWKLGTRFKDKLKLTNKEVGLVNKLWYPNNAFCNIEFCCIEVIRLYLNSINALEERFNNAGSSFEKEILSVADLMARKTYRYRTGSQNYKFCVESTSNELHSYFFKYCENAIREYFGHKRKLNTELNYNSKEAKMEFEIKLISFFNELLPELLKETSPPDKETEVLLNAQNTSRWKIKFEQITNDYDQDHNIFKEAIIQLGVLNKDNPSVENIFYEASKFIARHHRQTALELYIYYLHYDLRSATFDNKQLAKTIQKSLFNNNDQLRGFEKIISELIQDKDLDKALAAARTLYEVKRKRINLNSDSIKEVQQQHSGTVELLSEYLKDEFEDENNSIVSEEISSEEIKINITPKTEIPAQSIFKRDLTLNPVDIAVLELFSKSNYSVANSDLEDFAKSNGAFKNQLVERINESCYETLDDVLIEEEDDFYIINENYYQKILAL